MKIFLTTCLFALGTLSQLFLVGCSIGTEVGNGVKPSPHPSPNPTEGTAPKDDSEKNQENQGAPESAQNTAAGAEGAQDSDKKSRSTSSKSPSKPMGTSEAALEGIKWFILNTCASPFSQIYFPRSGIFQLVNGSAGQIKWTYKSDLSSNTTTIEWGDPINSTYMITKKQANNADFSINISATSVTPVGPQVTCTQVQIRSGELLGPDHGIVEEVSAALSQGDQKASIRWYTTNSGANKVLKMIRVQDTTSNIIYDFKPI